MFRSRRQPERITFWHYAETMPNIWNFIRSYKRRNAPRSVYLGLDGHTDDLVFSENETVTVLVGASGSNKTSAIVIQNILMHAFATLVFSSRRGVYIATAQLAAAMGLVWHYSPVGTELKGAKPIRWDPFHHWRRKRGGLQRLSELLANYIDRTEAANHAGPRIHLHFRDHVVSALYALFCIADLLDVDDVWSWLLRVLKSYGSELAKLNYTIEEIEETNDELGEVLRRHYDSLQFINSLSAEERGSVLTSIRRAIRCFENEDVLASTRNPNYDPVAWTQSCDTVYASEASVEESWAVLLGLFDFAHREAQIERCEEAEINGRPKPDPVLIVNDEAAALPPMNLLSFVSSSRGRGINFMFSVQTLGQLGHLYGEIAADLTQFPNVIIEPGIRHKGTLDSAVQLAGKGWVEVPGHSINWSPQGESLGDHESLQLIDALTAQQVSAGHPTWPDAVLYLRPGGKGFEWLIASPYYRNWPWLGVMVNGLCDEFERLGTYPLPELAQDGNYRYLDQAGMRDTFIQLQRKAAQP